MRPGNREHQFPDHNSDNTDVEKSKQNNKNIYISDRGCLSIEKLLTKKKKTAKKVIEIKCSDRGGGLSPKWFGFKVFCSEQT